MSRFLASIAILAVALGTGACESGSDPAAAGDPMDDGVGVGDPAEPSNYLGHVDHGCRQVRWEPGTGECRVLLDRVVYDGRVLTLHMRIDTWCCARFEVGAVTTDDTIGLQIVNAGEQCRCFCLYDVEFSFLWDSPGAVALSADYTFPLNGSSCSLETLITVQ